MKKSKLLKLFSLIMAAVFAAVFTGCKSTPVYLNDSNPVVILSVISNPRIPWDAESMDANRSGDEDYDEEGKGLLTNLVGKVVDKSNPEVQTAQDRVDYAADALTALLSETGGIEVVPHEKLDESKYYRGLGNNVFNYLESTSVATDYINDMQVGAKTARMIMEDIGAKGMVMASFTFQKTVTKGTTWNGELAAKVKMKIRLLDENGKQVVDKEYTVLSEEKFEIYKRKYDKDALVEAFQPTIDNAINQFIVQHIQ